MNLYNGVNQKFWNAKAETTSGLLEFQLLSLLYLRRQKFDVRCTLLWRKLHVCLKSRCGDRFLVLDAAAPILFVLGLLAVVVHEMQRELISVCRARCGDTNRCRCVEVTEIRWESVDDVAHDGRITPSWHDVIRDNIEEHMLIEQTFANFLEPLDTRHIPFMHAAARKEQQHFGARPVRAIQRFVLPQETVVAHELTPRLPVFEGGVESHWRATISRKLCDRRANADAFVFSQRERLLVECAAAITRLQRRLAQ